MVQFRHRVTSSQSGVGHQLKVARRSLGLTLDDVAEQLSMRKMVLLAVERGAFQEIPEPFYRDLIVKTYGEYLGFDWNTLSQDYCREAVYHETQTPGSTPHKTVQRTALVVAPRLIKNCALGAIMVGVGGYLAFWGFAALTPPRLVVMNPPDNFETSGNTTLIRGKVTDESDIHINGQQVLKREDGTFEQEVALSRGVNVISVAAAKKYSKETVVTRRILYQEPATP